MLTMRHKKAVTRELRDRYQRSSKKEKTIILNWTFPALLDTRLRAIIKLKEVHFQPVRKLIKKERIGSKITKTYDEAKTPYRRVLASPDIEDEIKMKLKSQYAMLNPAELKRKITKLQNKLLKLNALKQKAREDLLEKSVES